MQLIDHILAATIATERRRDAERHAAWRRGTRRRGATRIPRVWIVLALAAATALVAAAQASALAPTTAVEQRDVKLAHGDCGAFTLIFEADVTRKVTTFYDQDGVPVRDVLVRRSEGTVSNSVTGRSVPSMGVWRVTRYYADGQLTGRVTQAGRTYLITEPGLGVIFHQTGYGIQQDGQTNFEAGPHDFEHGNVDELCAYLAG
jgi:hypothetical protein